MTVHIVPIRLKAPATIEAMFAGPMRYGAPTMLGASGHYTASREPIWIIAFEWPDALPITDKAAKEQLHLNRFLADFEAGLQRPPYRTVRRGPDPPDFICTEVDGGQVGVELTQLMVEDRVEASAQFGRLKKAILVAGPSRFAKVQGHVVTSRSTRKAAKLGRQRSPTLSPEWLADWQISSRSRLRARTSPSSLICRPCVNSKGAESPPPSPTAGHPRAAPTSAPPTMPPLPTLEPGHRGGAADRSAGEVDAWFKIATWAVRLA